MRGIWVLAGVLLCMPLGSWAGESMAPEALRAGLKHLQAEGWWGELALAGGTTREVKVDSVCGDTVAVHQILGALLEEPAVYPLSQIMSLRELGAQRIPLRRAAFASHKSMPLALGLEVAIPGAGYFYTGQQRQGLILLALAGAAVGTGLATGKSGAAGWVPLAAWVKLASLVDLHAELRGINAATADRLQAGTPLGMQLSWVF